MKIHFIDLQRQYHQYKQEIDSEIAEVIENSSFIMGEKIGELEMALAKYVGMKYAASCASGTDALLLSLMTYDLQPGDEIITTPFTFIATAETIALLKLRPVFVDIREDTFNIDPAKIEKAITKKTRGIITVDIFGQCADYDEINTLAKSRKLFVIEDAAQSFGAQYKGKKACSLADIACTSFFPAKPLGCYGDGGMVFTNDEKTAEITKSLRLHGKGNDKYDHVRIGFNSRMDTLQAAVVLAKFPHLEEEIKKRQDVAGYYTQKLKSYVTTPRILEHNLSVFAQYSIVVSDRAGLQKRLSESNIPTAIHYPKPLHLQQAFAYLGYQKGACLVAERVSREIISLPLHPFLKSEEQDFIIEAIRSYYKTN